MSEQQQEQQAQEPKVDVVPRETFEKLLTEKKNYAEKTKALEARLQEIETAKLKEKEDFKTMYELTQKKAQELEQQLASIEQEKVNSRKLSKLTEEFKKMGVKDPTTLEALLKLSQTDALKYDPETNVVLGIEDEAKRVKSMIPVAFGSVSAAASHDAPQGAPSAVTMEQYNKMIADGSFFKMSKEEQKAFTAKLYNSLGINLRK